MLVTTAGPETYPSNLYMWFKAEEDFMTLNYISQTGTVSITSGTNVVTGTSTTFTASDIGKKIRIAASGGSIDKYIIGRSSNTSITVGNKLAIPEYFNVTESGLSYNYAFVQRWTAANDNTIYVEQLTDSKQPVLLINQQGKQSCMAFDGVDDNLYNASLTIPSLPKTFFVNSMTNFILGHYFFTNPNFTFWTSSGNITRFFGSGITAYLASDGGFTDTTRPYFTDPAIPSLYIKGTIRTTSGDSGQGTQSGTRIGAGPSETFFNNFNMYEIIMYSTAPSTTQRNDINKYLKVKYKFNYSI